MTAVDVHVDGLIELRAELAAAVGRTETATRVALVASLATVENAAKNQLRKTSHPKRTRTPSAPGTPPSLVTGALLRSIATHGPVGGGGIYVGRLGPSIIYGRIQELGGVAGRGHRAHLPARPYLKPAMEESAPVIETTFIEAWSGIFA